MSRFLIFLLLLTQSVATMSQPSNSVSSSSSVPSSPYVATESQPSGSVSSSSSAPSSPYVATLSQPSWEQLFRDWLTTEDADYSEETFELLSTLADNKLNLNQTTREQLEQLPFLSAQQIEELIAYLDRYKPMRTLNELLMIESLDWDTRRLLACFVYCGPETAGQPSFRRLSTMLKEGRHSLMATVRIPMYQRKGDQNGYAGYRYRHDLRYQFNYRNRLKFGLTGAQDAGEPFFSNKNTLGYDHYSYYFQLRDMGRLEELNLGMYRVQLGMGLVMNTGFHMGKLSMLQSQGRSRHVLTAHTSRSASGYLNGAAATWRFQDSWRLTAFASYRPLDATLNTNATVRTIVRDGYHRTTNELAKKNNTHLLDLGFRLAWRQSLFGGLATVSLNALYSHFDRRLMPTGTSSSSSASSPSPYVATESQPSPSSSSPSQYVATESQPSPSQLYRQYALAGNDFLHTSLDYSFTNYRLSFSGETAVSRNGAFAAVHTFSYRLSDQWSLMLLHRYYDKRYAAFHAYSFSEGGATQNEHGIYLGASWAPSRTTLIKAYADYAHFPWARYQVSIPSDAFDAMLLARTLLYNRVTVEARYRFHLRQLDNNQLRLLLNRYEHRARLRLTLPLLSPSSPSSSPSSSPYVATPSQPSSHLSTTTQLDAALIDHRTARSRGLMLSQQVEWKHRWLQLNACLSWFHTDDYDSRLYQYEPSVRYDFSFPMYYGHGLRYSLMARAEWGRLLLAAKIGTTNYFDRAVISSGLQQIDRSSMTDLLLQVFVRL